MDILFRKDPRLVVSFEAISLKVKIPQIKYLLFKSVFVFSKSVDELSTSFVISPIVISVSTKSPSYILFFYSYSILYKISRLAKLPYHKFSNGYIIICITSLIKYF